jgi:hypothetical protein
MTLASLVLVALLLWSLGYVQARLVMGDMHKLLGLKLIKVPRILYFLYGRPKAKGLPAGVMPLSAVVFQLTSLILVVCCFFAWIVGLEVTNTNASIGILGSWILGTIGALILYKVMPYR